VQLLPIGEFRARDGRPQEVAHWFAGQTILEKAATRATKHVIDYEHQTLNAKQNGRPAPAAGWFSKITKSEDGYYADGVEFTDKAKAMIQAGEYRYISPVFSWDQKTGEILEIHNAALVNDPAIDGMSEVTAASYFTNLQEGRMNPATIQEMLELPADASDDQVQAAIAKLIEAVKQKAKPPEENVEKSETPPELAEAAKTNAETVAALQTEIAELKNKALAQEITALIAPAIQDGRLLPNMREWAEQLGRLNIESLKAYLDKAQPITALNTRQTTTVKVDEQAHTLSPEQTEIIAKMGINPEDFIKTEGMQ
jgi:phage I-like protein